MHKVIWLNVLNGMPHFYYSCPTLKPIHYHLVSNFKIRPGLLLTCGTWTQHCFLSSQQKQRRKCLEFVVTFGQMFMVLIDRHPLALNPQKVLTCNYTGTSQRPFCWSSTPSPPTRKMVSKPRTGRKCKRWWCFVLHDLLPFVDVPFRNNVQYHTKLPSISSIYFNHSVYIYIYIYICVCMCVYTLS